jgi:alpha-1,3-rhamnosyl/mannosyltransferase
MRIWTIVVHFGDPEHTRRAIAAVATSTQPSAVVLVDHSGNCPDDLGATVLRPGRNAGFAAGANLGARHALNEGATSLWFLNNDAEPQPDTLERLVRTAEEGSQPVMVGSLEVDPSDPDPQGPWANRAPILPAPLRGGVRAVNGRLGAVDFLSGFSLLVSGEAFERAGPWDESFFHYFEDVEYSVRAARMGVELILDCAAPTSHRRATALVRGSRAEAYYFFRNRLLLASRLWRRHPLLVWLTVDPRRGLLSLVSRRRLLARDWGWLRGAWRGTIDGLRGRTGPAPWSRP